MTRFNFREPDGTPIIWGKVEVDPKTPRPESIGSQNFVVPDVLERTEAPNLAISYTTFNPGFEPIEANDVVEFNPESEFGSVLEAVKYRAVAVLSDPDCQVVLDTAPEEKKD